MNETARDRITLDDGEVHLWPLAVDAIDLGPPEQTLDATELSRAGQFHAPEHARRYVAARGLLRLVLSYYLGCGPREIAFEPGTYGKPGLKCPDDSGLKFNLSHSGGILAIAVARREVGVDVERIDPAVPVDEIARFVFSPAEQSLLAAMPHPERTKAFYRLWTRKEALLKATGEGLNQLSPDIDTLTHSVLVRPGRTWHVRDFKPGEGYAGALAVDSEDVRVKYMGWNEKGPG